MQLGHVRRHGDELRAPGPEAQQLATYIGWLMHRSWGGIVAGAPFVLPSLFIVIVLAAGLVGCFGARRWPQVFALGGGHGAAKASDGPALIDDHTPTPPRARLSRRHLARVLRSGLGLWLLVGVILNLALFFAWHVLWLQGFDRRFDGPSAVIALASAVAPFRFKVGVMPLLAGSAVAGLALSGLPALR